MARAKTKAFWGPGYKFNYKPGDTFHFDTWALADGRMNIVLHPDVLTNKTATAAAVYHEFHEMWEMAGIMAGKEMDVDEFLFYVRTDPNLRPGGVPHGGIVHNEAVAFENMLAKSVGDPADLLH